MAYSASSAVPTAAAAVGYNTETFGPAVTLGSNWLLWTDAANVKQNSDGSVTIAGAAMAITRRSQRQRPMAAAR